MGIADNVSSTSLYRPIQTLNVTTHIINCMEKPFIFEYQNLVVEIRQSIHSCFLGILFPSDTHGLACGQDMAFLIILADIRE